MSNIKNITDAEYESGECGIYEVEKEKILYKKIECSGYFKMVEEKSFFNRFFEWFGFSQSMEKNGTHKAPLYFKYFDAIAKLRIPIGAKIVTPVHVDQIEHIISDEDTMKSKSLIDYVMTYFKYNTDGESLYDMLLNNTLRTDKAYVEEIKPVEKFKGYEFNSLCECHSFYDLSHVYQLGNLHTPKQELNTDINFECHSGIHGVRTPEEAIAYQPTVDRKLNY